MTGTPHDFDVLNRWASLADEDLARLATDEAVSVLRRIARLLAGTPIAEINDANFVSVVRRMRELYRQGSRGLGETILKAAEFERAGNVTAARNAYMEFISMCPSEFYKRIARNHLANVSGA